MVVETRENKFDEKIGFIDTTLWSGLDNGIFNHYQKIT